jgi:hypothetical protein
LRLIYFVAIPRVVVLESKIWRGSSKDLTLSDLPELTPSGSFRCLRTLKLRQLVEDTVGKLALRTVVAPIVEGSDLRTMLLELATEQVMLRWLAGEAVPILCQHHRDAATGHEVSYTVHTRPLKACAALAGVLHFLEYLESLLCCVLSQGFYLLRERVGRAGLLVGRDAGVEDGTARAVAVR